MFNDPLSLAGKTPAGSLTLPRINIDAGLGEFSKFSPDISAKLQVKHSSYKAKGATSATNRHTLLLEKGTRVASAVSSDGYLHIPYKVYMVIEHDSNAILNDLAEVVANVTNFFPTDSTANLEKLMNGEV